MRLSRACQMQCPWLPCKHQCLLGGKAQRCSSSNADARVPIAPMLEYHVLLQEPAAYVSPLPVSANHPASGCLHRSASHSIHSHCLIHALPDPCLHVQHLQASGSGTPTCGSQQRAQPGCLCIAQSPGAQSAAHAFSPHRRAVCPGAPRASRSSHCARSAACGRELLCGDMALEAAGVLC